VLEGADRVVKCTPRPAPYLGLLRVSKQVSAEALQMLYESKCYFLDFGRAYAMLSAHCTALQRFHRFYITLVVREQSFEWAIRKNRICRVLTAVAEQLLNTYLPNGKNVHVDLEMEFSPMDELTCRQANQGLDAFHSKQIFSRYSGGDRHTANRWRYVALYYKTQLQHFMGEIRKKLSELPNVKLKTNVDGIWPGVEVRRIDRYRISFKDTKKRLRGTVEDHNPSSNMRSHVHFDDWDADLAV
jgi:hypothetical protein